MKRILILLALLICAAAGALAQEKPVMRVYIAEETIDPIAAVKAVQLLNEQLDQVRWTAVYRKEGETLRDLVLADCTPALAICRPEEAWPWAEAGLLLGLQEIVGQQARMAEAVLASCVHDERLFMAPLAARHRQMAVNRGIFDALHLGYMLNPVDHPVWYPTEFQQILEEADLAGVTPLEIWLPQDIAAAEALVQSLFGGQLPVPYDLPDGGLVSGVEWLAEMTACKMIGLAQDRQAALERFLCGETAMFIDWTEDVRGQYAQEIRESGLELMTVPYPSATGLPVRSFELCGVCAFAAEDARQNELALRAAALLADSAESLLGSRAIWEDGARWLSDPGGALGATLSSLFGNGLMQVIGGECEPEEMLEMLAAEMRAVQEAEN